MKTCSSAMVVLLFMGMAPGSADPVAELRSSDGELRAQAAWAIGSGGDRAGVQSLVAAAGDPYAPARAAALWGLGRLGDGNAAPVLERGLADADRNVRLAAARGIGAGGRKALFSLLAARLDYAVKEEPDEKDPKRLVERVDWKEPDPGVRLAIVQALGSLKVVDAIPAMIYALERENSYNRVVLVQTIEGFGPTAAGVCLGRIVPTPYDKEAFEKRMPLLIGNGALAAIAGRLGDDRCVPYLLKTLKLPRKELGVNKDLTELYINTVQLLGRFKVESAAEPLAAILKETRIRQLSETVQAALRSIGPAAARPLAANADDWQLAAVFLPLLREPQLRSDAIHDTLVKFLANESDEVRREATETLGLYIHEGIFDEYDIPLLEAMAMDPDRNVRQVCAKWKERINAKLGEGSVQ